MIENLIVDYPSKVHNWHSQQPGPYRGLWFADRSVAQKPRKAIDKYRHPAQHHVRHQGLRRFHRVRCGHSAHWLRSDGKGRSEERRVGKERRGRGWEDVWRKIA